MLLWIWSETQPLMTCDHRSSHSMSYQAQVATAIWSCLHCCNLVRGKARCVTCLRRPRLSQERARSCTSLVWLLTGNTYHCCCIHPSPRLGPGAVEGLAWIYGRMKCPSMPYDLHDLAAASVVVMSRSPITQVKVVMAAVTIVPCKALCLIACSSRTKVRHS